MEVVGSVQRHETARPAGRRDDFAAEVFGALNKGQGTYFRGTCLMRCAAPTSAGGCCGSPRHLWVSIDPASHGRSDLAMVAFVVADGGMHVVVGLSNVNVGKCQTTEVQQVVRQFLSRTRQHPAVPPDAAIVPIVECNNNEILAMSIVRVFEQFGPV